MKKLTKNSSLNEFYETIRELILSKDSFTPYEIFRVEMPKQCEDEISLNFLKFCTKEVVEELLENGEISYIDEGVGYYNVNINKKSL